MPEGSAGLKSGAVFLFAIIGAPLGGYITDRWRKKRINARLIVPAFTSLLSAGLVFLAFSVFGGQHQIPFKFWICIPMFPDYGFYFEGTFQYLILLSFGISITAFVAAAAAVTQDVVHAGLRAISYAIAVVIQNLLGASLGPITMGAISDATNIETALSILPIALLLASALFFTGSFFYEKDLRKVEKITIEAVE
jgi:MFS family permease